VVKAFTVGVVTELREKAGEFVMVSVDVANQVVVLVFHSTPIIA
jgi:hypothetical protein